MYHLMHSALTEIILTIYFVFNTIKYTKIITICIKLCCYIVILLL